MNTTLIISLDEHFKQRVEDLSQLQIVTKRGLIPLTAVGELRQVQSAPSIMRRDKRRVIKIDGNIAKGTPEEVQKLLNKIFKKLDFPEGYGYVYTGISETQGETMKDMSQAMLVAIILTFMLMAALLNSVKTPFALLMSVATSVVGAFLFLFFAEITLNLASMLAMVMIVGLSVNNSILLVDHTMHRLRAGDNVRDALWNSAKAKFRVILMTSLAIVAGVLPAFFGGDATKMSIAAVEIGGMLASIVFTFLLTPVIYETWGCQHGVAD